MRTLVLSIVAVLVIGCGATRKQIDTLLTAQTAQAKLYAANSISYDSFLNAVIDATADPAQKQKFRDVQQRLRSNDLQFEGISLGMVNSIMSLETIPEGDRQQYVLDIVTIIGAIKAGTVGLE